MYMMYYSIVIAHKYAVHINLQTSGELRTRNYIAAFTARGDGNKCVFIL